MGAIEVPQDKLLGRANPAVTEVFRHRPRLMPRPVIRALGVLKKACAMVNQDLGKLPADKVKLIARRPTKSSRENSTPIFRCASGRPGSGTQTNMNANEVISNRAIELAGGVMGSKSPMHPNDHVNMSQSSNDTFPTAMHIAAVEEVTTGCCPPRATSATTSNAKRNEFDGIVKIGRTHLQDATPVTFGQEFSGYVS